ncbi:hypothetical protein [Gabonibacter chumensis]|uniref:hypothetical protein n=1 Tax=Gabonibacter chumensis TaxID=2972474 RepID=UPI002573AB93|nr:hypothetical protein [Gabonibacter chumensis]MCR9012110.1 hypothetical protein [Gabonibacter chumensis]
MSKQIVMVLVNKNWEIEPVLSALTNPKLRPITLPFPEYIDTPKDGDNKMDTPRAIFRLSPDKRNCTEISIWCIEDLMSPEVNSSSSEEKYRVLPSVIAKCNPQLVISVSTANYPVEEGSRFSANGSVYLGTNFFIHNGHPDNPESNLQTPYEGQLLTGHISSALLDTINRECGPAAVKKFITPSNAPATWGFTCEILPGFSAVSSINITDYQEYDNQDKIAKQHFEAIAPLGYELKSIETTHGIVRVSTECPVIFLSPITDRLGHFDEDVSDTQNYAVAFNGGLALGEIFCVLNRFNGLL